MQELIDAITNQNIQGFRLLVEQHGIDLNYQDANNQDTALHHAARDKDNGTQFVDSLLAKNINPNIPNKYGLTPLMIAVNGNNLAVIKQLLDNPKVDLDFKNKNGLSAKNFSKSVEIDNILAEASKKRNMSAKREDKKNNIEINRSRNVEVQEDIHEVVRRVEQWRDESPENLKKLIDKGEIETFKKLLLQPTEHFYLMYWREVLQHASKEGKLEFVEALYANKNISPRILMDAYLKNGFIEFCKKKAKALPEMFDQLNRYPLIGEQLKKIFTDFDVVHEICHFADDETLKNLIEKIPGIITENSFIGLYEMLHKVSMIPVLLENKTVKESITSWFPNVIQRLILEGNVAVPILKELFKSSLIQKEFHDLIKTHPYNTYDFMEYALMSNNMELAQFFIDVGYFGIKSFEYHPQAIVNFIGFLFQKGDANISYLKAIAAFESVKKSLLSIPEDVKLSWFKWAMITNNVGILQFMQDMGMEIDFAQLKSEINTFPEKNKDSLLVSVIKNGNIELVKKVLNLGADPALPDRNGWSPLDVARSLGYRDIVAVLKEKESEFAKQNADKVNKYKDFQNQCERIRASGHILGLGKKISLLHPTGEKIEIDTEGNIAQYSAHLMKNFVGRYINQKRASPGSEKYFAEINKALTLEAQFLQYEDSKALDEMLNNLNEKPRKLTFIPCCWNEVVHGQTGGHAVGLGVYGNLIFFTDRAGLRGEPGEIVGTSIYKLKDDLVFTKEMLESLIPPGIRPKREQILDRIKALTDENYHRFDIETSAQNRGNCSIANRKSNIEPALFVQDLYAQGEKRVQEFLSSLDNRKRANETEEQYKTRIREETLAGPKKGINKQSQTPEVANILTKATTNYKHLTRFSRDDEIQSELSQYKSATYNNNEPNKLLSKSILNQYITYHHGDSNWKPKQRFHGSKSPEYELERIQKILIELPESERKTFIEELDKSSRKETGSSAVLALAKNAKLHGFSALRLLIGESFISQLEKEESEKAPLTSLFKNLFK